MPEQSLTGIYGKLPSHGDFVRHNLDDAFVDPWDEWLRRGLFESRRTLGDQWLGLYLESPVWRFAIDAEIAGPHAMAGVMLPSVDAVGRYFPFTLAARTGETGRAAHWRTSESWYDRAATKALTVLDEEFDLSTFLTDIAALPAIAADWAEIRDDVWIEAEDAPGWDLLELVRPCSLFWSDGSPQVKAGLVVGATLPSPQRFTLMLGGSR